MLTSSRSVRGFTLIELLVAVAAMGVVVFYTLGTFTVQHQAYVVVDQVSETQQNGRAIASLIERDVRQAGYMVPDAAAVCASDSTTGADLLVTSDAGAILPVDELPATLAARDLGADVSTAIPSLNPGDALTLAVDSSTIDGTATYDNNGDGTTDSDFQIGGGAILVDINNPGQGVACGSVLGVTATAVRVSFVAGLSGTAPLPSEFRLVPAHIYQLVSPGGDAPSELRRNGVMLAKDVEDLQLALFYDDDGDGQVDDPGETRGVSGTNYDSTTIDGADLREVRMNVTVRTRGEDPRERGDFSQGQIRENRTSGSVAGADERRRRTHTATVRVRNLNL